MSARSGGARSGAMGGRRWTGPLAITGIVLAIGVIAASLQAFGQEAFGWQMAARFTARLSFLMFLIPYLASSFAILLPSGATRSLVRERRGFGLAFAGAHFVHLGALSTFMVVAGEAPGVPQLVFGGFGYVMIALMAATSNDWSVRKLGANWARLHAFGLNYVWFVFVVLTYARRIATFPDKPEYVVLFAIGIAALSIRLAAWSRRRQALAQ
jgi:methionine sulfoxide reductase heme-binding subunit